MDRKTVYSLIDGERDYQDALREEGVFTEMKLPVAGELLCIKEYVDRAISSYVGSPGESPEETLAVIRKITAIGVRIMEHWGAPPR